MKLLLVLVLITISAHARLRRVNTGPLPMKPVEMGPDYVRNVMSIATSWSGHDCTGTVPTNLPDVIFDACGQAITFGAGSYAKHVQTTGNGGVTCQVNEARTSLLVGFGVHNTGGRDFDRNREFKNDYILPQFEIGNKGNILSIIDRNIQAYDTDCQMVAKSVKEGSLDVCGLSKTLAVGQSTLSSQLNALRKIELCVNYYPDENLRTLRSQGLNCDGEVFEGRRRPNQEPAGPQKPETRPSR